MKKIIAILLTALFVLSLAACSANNGDPDTTAAQNAGEIPEGVDTVRVTLPAYMFDEGTTAASLKESLGDAVFAVEQNADGSFTYVMTPEQQSAKLAELKQNVDDSIAEVTSDEDFTVTAVEYTDDMSAFKVTVSGEALGDFDSYAGMLFEMQAQIYRVYLGAPDEAISIKYFTPDGTEITDTESTLLTETVSE